MLKALMAQLQKLVRTPTPVDPKSFNDPLAERTQWTPAKGGGANFCTSKLHEAGPGRFEFRPTIGMKLFAMVFLLMGLGAVTLGINLFFFVEAPGHDWGALIPVLVGAVFAAVGGGMLHANAKPLVFDRTRSLFYRGAAGAAPPKDYIELSRIHALQLISERCTGKNSSYYSYELNLILDDASRVNVADHGDRERLREDAQTLASFLGKPIWDAIAR
ncbi:MAG: hypothetical protein ABIJ96_14630 [Elusimicrobiota bacterium]